MILIRFYKYLIMNDLLISLRKELSSNTDEVTKKSSERFFKEEVNVYGIKTAVVGKIAKDYFNRIKDLKKEEIFEICEELWKSGMLEESFLACDWTYKINKQYEEKDFEYFERIVKTYIANWASCDTFCNHTVGSFVEMFPSYINKIKGWSKSSNRWVKRASAVTFIIPARHGEFLKDIFEIADTMLMDKDDMVQKGYGWMLKAASQAHEKDVFDYVMAHKDVMPRTSLRYAIEKMPKELKVKAMEK